MNFDVNTFLKGLTEGYMKGKTLKQERAQQEQENELRKAQAGYYNAQSGAKTDTAQLVEFLKSQFSGGNGGGTTAGANPSLRLKGMNVGGMNFEVPQSEEALRKERQDKFSDEVAKKELTSMATNLPKLEQALQSINQLEDLYYKGATPDKNPILARTTGIPDAVKAKMGFNPELNSYINNSKAFAGLIAKGGFGEAGMLTNQDIARVVAALPTTSSTDKEAKIGFQEIRDLLSSARERYEAKKSAYLGGNQGQQNNSASQNQVGKYTLVQ